MQAVGMINIHLIAFRRKRNFSLNKIQNVKSYMNLGEMYSNITFYRVEIDMFYLSVV